MKTKNNIMHKMSLGSALLVAMVITASLPAKLQGADGVASSIYFQNSQGYLGAWTADGTTVTSSRYLIPNQTGDTNWTMVGSADFDGEGSRDLVFQHTNGTLGLWYMNGNTLNHAAYLSPARVDPGWRVVAVADFNKDGKPDLLFQHRDGTIQVWTMNGAGLVSASILPASRGIDAQWRVAGAADLDDDGNSDILFQHSGGTVGIWYMHGQVLNRGVASPPVDPSWRVVGAKDFNGDRKPDLMFQHHDGTLGLWLIESPTFSAVANADGTSIEYVLTWPAVVATTLLNPSQAAEGWRVVAVSN
jgi:hypothetical protein